MAMAFTALENVIPDHFDHLQLFLCNACEIFGLTRKQIILGLCFHNFGVFNSTVEASYVHIFNVKDVFFKIYFRFNKSN